MGTMKEHHRGGANEREALGFARAVEQEFRFLVAEHGFDVVQVDVTLVRYESRNVFVNVYHGRRSYEINVELGRLDDPHAHRYGLRDVLVALLGVPTWPNAYFLQSSNRDGVQWCVATAADLVKQHYGPVLRGDATALARVAESTSERSGKYTREVVQRPVRDAAELAWHRKDLAAVARHYGLIRQDLTPFERRRLEYAEKHAQGG